MKIVRTTCRLCYNNCGVRVRIQGGVPVKISGDPENPYSRGKLCPKGLASLELLNHPDRLTTPLKRRGARGAGDWVPITWDEALQSVADGLNRAKCSYS